MTTYFGAIVQGQWQPGIGDPTFIGWFTVFAYFVTAFLSGYYATRPPLTLDLSGKIRFSLVWWGLSFCLVFLAINKQLDLQTLFTQIGREIAISFGFYEIRRLLQFFFILTLLFCAIVGFVLLHFVFRREFKNHFWALFGIVFLLFFIVVRAASFHHIDTWLSFNLKGFQLNWIFELGGISCIAYSLWLNLFYSSKRK